VPLDHIPLTANGKVDRKAVAQIASAQLNTGEDEPPQGPIEESLGALWSDLLKVPGPGRDTSFFLLGGDSVLATEFVERARRELGLDIGLRQMLDAPSIRQLATSIQNEHRKAPIEEGAL
jgi:yersiniabactin nonribosomal peptide synthetase